MTTAYTSLLGLALPVTGELDGTWGDVVNNYLTGYVDASVAGAQTISGNQTGVTLSTTNGSALTQAGGAGVTGSAQYQIINCTGNPSGTLTITAPATSKTYIVINQTSTSQSVILRGAGPTTGVTIASGDKALVAWNGSDFVRVGASAGGSNTQVQYNNGGNLAGSANMTFDGTKLTVGGLNNTALTASKPVFTDGSKNLVSTGTMPVDQGGTGQTSYTDGQLLIGNTATGGLSKATLTAGSNITITNGNGTISIAAGSTVAIGNITGATANGALYANSGGTVTSGTLPVGSGGIGVATLTGIAKGNGTSAFSAATAGTDYVAPGTATTFTATQTFSGSTSVLGAILTDTAEVCTVSATAATGTINYDVTTQSVLYYTSNAGANWTVNFRGSSGTSLNTLMSTGQSLTVAFLVTQGATAYYNNAITIDGNSVTPKYQGGTAWSAGNASSIDAYTYTIIKTGNAAFTVFAAQTQFK